MKFKVGDRVQIISKDWPCYKQTGKIVSNYYNKSDNREYFLVKGIKLTIYVFPHNIRLYPSILKIFLKNKCKKSVK